MKRSSFWTLVGAFLFLGLLVYGQSLGNGFVRWDDGLLIYENPAIRGFSLANLKTIFTTYDPELYIPLTLLSYQFDYMISGIRPEFYHLHSLLLHIANALLVVWFSKRLLGNYWIGIVTGLLFLLHPLNTEAVAWASGRKDVLSTMFFLLSCIGYDVARESESKKWVGVSVFALALGLLAKVTILTAPVIFLLIDYVKGRKWNVNVLLPYIGLSILFAVIAYFGKTGVLDSSTPLEKILIAPMSTMFYIQKLILPLGLAVIYPFTGAVEFLSARILIPILLCIALAIIGLLHIKKNRTLFFGLVFFAITLSPTLFNFAKGDFLYFASDRYAYIPSIGILLLIAFALCQLKDRYEKPTYGITLVVLVVCSVLTMKQSLVWANSEALFTHNLQHYPKAHTAHNNLGNIYRTRGELSAAVDSYNKALALSEEFGRGDQALYGQAKILSNLASAYRAGGDLGNAAISLQKAETLDPLNPHAKLQKGLVAFASGNSADAEQAYKQALELQKHFTTAQINLGSLYVSLGRLDEATEVLSEATEWNPFYPQAFYNLGIAYRKLGRNRESLEAYEKAVDLEPAFVAARINLGILYAERKKIDEAIVQFQEVLRYDPSNARAVSALRQLGAL